MKSRMRFEETKTRADLAHIKKRLSHRRDAVLSNGRCGNARNDRRLVSSRTPCGNVILAPMRLYSGKGCDPRIRSSIIIPCKVRPLARTLCI